ncbi:MAG: T9SS type A sorting domain-containing protein [Sporocytophaga sp.]|nr:T9SS type A sorting domain-containing protein [Sporocytophaga sp.]
MFLKHVKALGGVLSCLFISGTIYAQNYPAVLDVSSLNGVNGFAVPALKTGDRIGSDLDFIGDLNGDGFDDIAIGSQEQNNTGFKLGGTAYIIFGSDQPFASTFDLSSLDGTNGFIVKGIAEDERRGGVVKGLGDVNNDGIDDIVIGSEGSKHIILYGKKSSYPASITVNDINGTNGFIIDQSGINEITGAGDVNGDGISDIILGQAHWSGQTWVIFGKNGNFPATVTSTYVDGVNGFKVSSANNTSRPSYHVGSAGDINNDGYDDIIIGNWSQSITTNAKLTHVVFGRPAPFPALIDINTLNGTNGFAIENYGGSFLKWVGKVGDINGDGIDDIYSDNSIIMGSSKPFPAVVTKDNTLDGKKGFLIPNVGLSMSSAGDLNFDGVDDFIAIASGQEAYVIFGRKNGFDATFNVADLDGAKGFKIKDLSISNIGRPVGGNHDFNGDGKADFVIGSEYTQSKGVVYVVFGGDHIVLPLEDTYPKVSKLGYESFDFEVKAKEKGTIYYAIFKGTPQAITKQSVIRSGLNALQFGAISVENVNTIITKTITDLAMGTSYTVYLYQEDEIGNIGTIYKLENIKTLTDTEGPTFLVCPSDQMVGESVLPNFLDLVEVADNRDENPSVSQTPAAGKNMIDGMIITITAVDNLNNYSTCTFKVYSLPTSINDATNAGIKVYPNPVQNMIYLDGDANYHYKIVNVVGLNCMEGVTNSTINVESLNAGFYTIQLYTQDGQLRHQQKLVKE